MASMRVVVAGAWVLVVAAGCGKPRRDGQAVASAPARSAPDAPLPAVAATGQGDLAAICATMRRYLEREARCAPGRSDALRNAGGAIEDLGPDATPEALARRAAMCAGITQAYDSMMAGGGPDCHLTADERARNDAFLTAYHARRTAPRPTGDATLDQGLRDLAAARDAMCACNDEDCVRAAHAVVNTAVPAIPREQTAAVADAVAISDEVTRCAYRVADRAADARP